MKAWVVLCLLHALLAKQHTEAKRFDPFMLDPLMRRSSLDKNFMRFGRSSPSFTESNEVEESHEFPPEAEAGKTKPIVLGGRSKNDDFLRLGRGKQENFMRFGKARSDSSFMRFGRGRQDSYMRLGRGKQDSYMRFGRGKQDNFMRFGRGRQDHLMRFGRGKQDSFIRFGRNSEVQLVDQPPKNLEFEPDFSRDTRSKQNSFIRFGRGPDLTIASRPERSKQSGFIRFGKSLGDFPHFEENSERYTPFFPMPRGHRAKQDSFIRFGKSDTEQEVDPDKKRSFTEAAAEKSFDLTRSGRASLDKNDGFIRFGRNPEQAKETNIELIPQRLKRSVDEYFVRQDDAYPLRSEDTSNQVPLAFSSVQKYIEEEYAPKELEEDLNVRRKRSLSFQPKSTPVPEENPTDYIFVKHSINSSVKPEYHSSVISAGLPNVIVGPEFSLLPVLDPPSSMRSGSRPGDQSFLRLG